MVCVEEEEEEGGGGGGGQPGGGLVAWVCCMRSRLWRCPPFSPFARTGGKGGEGGGVGGGVGGGGGGGGFVCLAAFTAYIYTTLSAQGRTLAFVYPSPGDWECPGMVSRHRELNGQERFFTNFFL